MLKGFEVPTIPDFGKPLTKREEDAMAAFCNGFETQKEVARELGISHRTVERHMQSAMVKLGARTQQMAVLMWDRRQRATAVEEALASLEAGMVQGAADTLREALAASS